MNRYLKDSMTPVSGATSSAFSGDPAIVGAVNWLTQLGTEPDPPMNEHRANAVVDRGFGQELAMVTNSGKAGLDISFKNGERVRIVYTEIVGQNLTANVFLSSKGSGSPGDLLWHMTLIDLPDKQSSIVYENAYVYTFDVGYGGVPELVGNPFVGEFGSNRGYTYQMYRDVPVSVEYQPTAATVGSNLDPQNYRSAKRDVPLSEFSYKTIGPVIPWTDGDEAIWSVTLAGSVVTMRPMSFPEGLTVPLTRLTVSTGVPEGAFRVSGGFKGDGTPVICYQICTDIYYKTLGYLVADSVVKLPAELVEARINPESFYTGANRHDNEGKYSPEAYLEYIARGEGLPV